VEPKCLTVGEKISGVDWTADSRNVVFSSDRSGTDALWLVPASGGPAQRLAAAGDNSRGISMAGVARRPIRAEVLHESH
jgi:Tol biopolymer transport system component